MRGLKTPSQQTRTRLPAPSRPPRPRELARPTARTWRACEGLGDPHPFLREGAVHGQPGVGDMPALGGDQAEVEGVAADALRACRVVPRPRRAVRGAQDDVDLDVGKLAAVAGVVEGSRS